MGDASNVATNLQVSRSGRILKKSVKLMDYEETGEASFQGKLYKATSGAKKSPVISSRPQKSKCARKLVFKNSATTSTSVCRNSSKRSRISSLDSFSGVWKLENVVPPIKITKISCNENSSEDPTYLVSPSSSKMSDESYVFSHLLDSTEESSSDSTAISSEFSGRGTSLSSHLGVACVVSDDISESISDEESSDNSSSPHQLLNCEEEHYGERCDSIESATYEDSSDDSSSVHQMSNSDEEHDIGRSNITEAVADEEPDLFKSTGCFGRKFFLGSDITKSAALKRKYPIGSNENTEVVPKKCDNRINSFMLWSRENRRKISAEYGHLSRKEVSKIVTGTWKTLDQKERRIWQRKAKQLALKGSTAQYFQSKRNTEVVDETLHEISDLSAGSSSLEKHFPLGTAPIDSAAHLALLGNSLTSLGLRIAQMDHEPPKTGIYSALLDSILCAIGPLLCLTREIAGLENLPSDNFQKILDHTAYFFPGL